MCMITLSLLVCLCSGCAPTPAGVTPNPIVDIVVRLLPVVVVGSGWTLTMMRKKFDQLGPIFAGTGIGFDIKGEEGVDQPEWSDADVTHPDGTITPEGRSMQEWAEAKATSLGVMPIFFVRRINASGKGVGGLAYFPGRWGIWVALDSYANVIGHEVGHALGAAHANPLIGLATMCRTMSYNPSGGAECSMRFFTNEEVTLMRANCKTNRRIVCSVNEPGNARMMVVPPPATGELACC